MILLNQVNKIYNESSPAYCHALKDINIVINKGEMVAIQGRSGSGKTTLLNIIGCIDRLTTGKYELNGIDITKLNDKQLSKIRNQFFGFVMQDFGLILGSAALENVSLPLFFGKESFKNIRNLSSMALCRVGIADNMHSKINTMSGGQKQRVAIARAIVTEPEVILADEPTGSLDSQTAREILHLLQELNHQGKTMIIVTHDEKVVQFCNRVINLLDGCISFL